MQHGCVPISKRQLVAIAVGLAAAVHLVSPGGTFEVFSGPSVVAPATCAFLHTLQQPPQVVCGSHCLQVMSYEDGGIPDLFQFCRWCETSSETCLSAAGHL